VGKDGKIIPGKLYSDAIPELTFAEGGKSIADLTYGDGIAVSATTVSSTAEAPTSCQNCGQRPGEVDWVGDGGAIAWAHGFTQRWCRLCCVRAQLEYAYKVVDTIPALEKELQQLEED